MFICNTLDQEVGLGLELFQLYSTLLHYKPFDNEKCNNSPFMYKIGKWNHKRLLTIEIIHIFVAVERYVSCTG